MLPVLCLPYCVEWTGDPQYFCSFIVYAALRNSSPVLGHEYTLRFSCAPFQVVCCGRIVLDRHTSDRLCNICHHRVLLNVPAEDQADDVVLELETDASTSAQQLGILVSRFILRYLDCLPPCCVPQEDLNDLFTGPRYDLSPRLSSVLNAIFVTMMYCGGE